MRVSFRRALATSAIAVSITFLAAGCLPFPPVTGNTYQFATSDCRPTSLFPVPCGSLGDRIRTLAPGDVLRIKPGVYDIDRIRIGNLTGAVDRRITVKADNPNDRPTIKGWLLMWRARYVSFENLRLQAAHATHGALSFHCGVGWTVANSELFGANATGAYWNLGIGGYQPGAPTPDSENDCRDEPRDFTITGNTFHHPYTDGSTSAIYHHIYSYFEGSTGTSGVISRNVFTGFTNGAGIKLGAAYPLAAWNVRVEFNTFHNGVRAIIMEDDVRGITFKGNLTDQIRGGGGMSGPNLSVALGAVAAANPSNVISHTYAANNTNPLQKIWGPVKEGPGVLQDGGDNAYRAGDDPQFNSTDPTVPGSFRPGNPQATAYGRYGSGSF
jgi:hypothetical protein